MSQTSSYRDDYAEEEKTLVTIDVFQGEEYRVQCSNVYDRSLFFHSAYRRAAEVVRHIHRANQIVAETDSQWRSAGDKESRCFDQITAESWRDSTRDGKYPNNIVMFCADRGGGKSSALLTFGGALGDLQTTEKSKAFYELWGDELNACRFITLDIIDPTLMGPKDSFMRLLLSKMFVSFRKKLEKKRDRGEEEQETRQMKILSLFRTCHQYLDILTGQKGKDEEFYDDLQQIIEIGDSSNLRQKFQELLRLYLKEMAGTQGPNEKHYLVIQIDDADLNTDCAYNMVEDLRKYCILPNIIVLMAVHIEQMQQIVEQHFADSFGTLLKHSRCDNEEERIMTVEHCRDMAMRYMDKVMPAGHQIHLPQIDQFIRNESARLTVRYWVRQRGEKTGGMGDRDALEYTITRENGREERVDGYQERLLRLVYEKTGIVLVKPATYLHNLLPQNMRELTHFLGFFSRLKDVDHAMSPANMCSILMQGSTKDEKEMQEKEKEVQRHLREINLLMGDGSGEISAMEKWMQRVPVSDARTQALAELQKREENLRELEEYFFNGWCTLRLEHKYNRQLVELRNAVATMKNSVAMGSSIVKKWKAGVEVRNRIPPLTERSYAQVQACLNDVFNHVLLEPDSAEKFRALYGVRFYYTLFLHREALSSLARVGNLSLLKRAMNYEAWSPWYRDLIENAEFGRFQVQTTALRKLLDDVKANRARENTWAIEWGCIIRRNNYEAYPLNDGTARLLKRQDITVVYDLGIFLLNYVCRDAGEMKDKELPIVDGLLQLLLNWDVQHQVEKADNFISRYEQGSRGQTEGESKPNLGLGNWSVDVMQMISGYLKEKTDGYLPFQWDVKDIEGMNYLDDLAFTNYDVACEYVGHIISAVEGSWEKSDYIRKENEKNREEFFAKLTRAVGDMSPTVLKLQGIRQYSESIRDFCDTWNTEIMDAINRIYELLSHFGEEEYRTPIETAVDDYEKAWAKGTQQFQNLKGQQKWKEELKTFIQCD